jgi:Domain of unknown function (DUF397)
MTIRPHGPITWRKSSHSTATDTCVELACFGAVRDSKNPSGPILPVDLMNLLAAIRAGRLER